MATAWRAARERLYRSPFGLAGVLALAVFLTETLVMLVLPRIDNLSPRTAVLLDSTILLLFILPCLHLLVLRPLALHIRERTRAEQALQREHDRVRSMLASMRDGEEQLRRSRDMLRNLSAHLQAAREEERKRVAREIHDELGQVLATLQLKLSTITAGLRPDQEVLAERARSMAIAIEAAVRTVQRMTAELRPVMLDDFGLPAAMEWHARKFEEMSGIRCELAIAAGEAGREVATAAFRIFQESLTNVLRHSGATRVETTLVEKRGRLVLMVRDDGRGVTREQVSDPRSFGFIGMRERAASLGGKTRICGYPGRGTVVIVRLPVAGGEEQTCSP